MRSPGVDDQETRSQLRPSLLEVPTSEEQCNFFQWTAYQPVWSEEQASGKHEGRKMPTPTRETERSYRTGSTTPQSSLGSRSPLPCQHRRTTRAGSNAFVDRTKCLECGKVIHVQPSSGDQRERGDQSGRSSKWQPTGEPDGTGDPATQQEGSRKEVGQDRELWTMDGRFGTDCW